MRPKPTARNAEVMSITQLLGKYFKAAIIVVLKPKGKYIKHNMISEKYKRELHVIC